MARSYPLKLFNPAGKVNMLKMKLPLEDNTLQFLDVNGRF